MRLFCDCKTDEEKSNFFLSGMAVETGVIAPAISNDVAMAYHRCAQFKKENDALCAKIERMERQEPVAWTTKLALEYGASRLGFQVSGVNMWGENGVPLYALPSAQPAPSIPDDVMRDAKRYRFLRAAKNIPISTEAARDPIVYDAAIDAAMLAAAPEAHRDDQHAGGLNVLNYQGLMERARKNAKKEAGLIYPDDDARREEKERELASEYYRQYTQRNTGVEP